MAVSHIMEKEITQQLLSYEQKVSLNAKIFLYIRGQEEIISSEGSMKYSAFEQSLNEFSDLTMSNFYTTVSSTNINVVKRLNSNSIPQKPVESLVTYVYPIPCMDSLPKASLIVMLSDRVISDMFYNYFGNVNAGFCILDNNNNITYLSEKYQSFLTLQDEFMSLKGIGCSDYNLNRKDYSVIRQVSSYSNSCAVIMMEKQELLNRVLAIKNVVNIVLLLFVFLEIGIALILSVRNYRPIKKILSNFTFDRSHKGLNEFDIIQKEWEFAITKNESLDKLIDLQRPTIVSSCIENILRGHTSQADELKFQLQCGNINLSRRYFYVMLLEPIQRSNSEEQMKAIESSLIFNFLYITAYSIRLIEEQKIAVVVNSDIEESNNCPISTYIAKVVQGNIKKTYGIKTLISVGSLYQELDNIRDSFIEATVVSREYIYAVESGIMTFKDVQSIEGMKYTYQTVEQSMLMSALKQGDKESAIKCLDGMIKSIQSTEQSFLFTQYQCYDIINNIIRTAGTINNNFKFEEWKSLFKFDGLDQFKTNATVLIIIVSEQFKKASENKQNKLGSDIMNFINENYKMNSMSLQSVADEFNLSSSYLSRFFKEQTSNTFMQYITFLRMDYVKNQLFSTDKTVNDIANEVGYLDVANFIRKFRIIEGVTPGEYRKNIKEAGR